MNVVSLKDFLKWTIMDFFLIVQKKKEGNSRSYPV